MLYLLNSSTTHDITLNIKYLEKSYERCDSKKHNITVYTRVHARARGGMRGETYSF